VAAAPEGTRLVRGSAARALAYGAGNLLMAGAAVLLLRHLGVADFGRYGAVIALLAIVQGVAEGGLGVTALRELALRDAPAQRALLAHVVGARVVLALAGVLVATGLSALFGYGGTLVAGTAVAGLGIVLASVQAALLLPLAVAGRQGRLAVNEAVRQGVVAGVVAVLVVADAPLPAFFFAHLAAGLVLMAVAPVMAGRRALVAPRFAPAALWGVVRVALPVALASVVAVVYYRALVVVVSLLEDERQTGLYVTAARVLEITGGLPMLLSVVAVPLLSVAARDDPARLERVLQRMTEVMAVAGVAVALGIGIGARPLLVLLGGEEYADAAGVLRVQCAALATLFVGAAWTPVLVGRGQLRTVAGVSAVGLATLLALGLPLTASAGIEGAAVAVVVADLVLLCGTGLALRRGGAARLDLRFVPRLGLAGAPALALAFVPGVPDAAAALAAVGLFLGLALALGLVPRALLAALGR
jgi:O-antigen/teichoic acid export membrane protein